MDYFHPFDISLYKAFMEAMEKENMARREGKKEKKVSKVMKEGYEGKLHSGSKKGPIVTNPSQMKAIAMSEAGLSKKGKK